MHDKFTAAEINFMGQDGYTVIQYHNGQVVCEQFISADCYEQFCEIVGIKPEVIE